MPLDRQELLTALRSVTAVANAPVNASQKRYSAAVQIGEGDKSSPMFACGGKINAAQFSLPCSFYVQGLGELPLPLSSSDIFSLIDLSEQAPYIKGSATAGDKSVREAHQIDASFLTCHPLNSTFFLHTAQAIAAHAVERLGMAAHNVHLDAKPYKLLLYEAGGQFAFHRGTERELGMSGTLIIQIPTLSPHQGDQLVVHNAHNSVTFDFSRGKSSRKFQFTAFFTDCQHMLTLRTMDSQVCLVFNLICHNMQVIPPHHKPDALSNSATRTEAGLKAWFQSYDEKGPQKIFIPLEHKYTKKDLCFTGLKGKDVLVTEVMRRCRRNMPQELSFELSLCIIDRHRTCEGEDEEYYLDESEFQATKWIAENDREVAFSSIKLDLDSELLVFQDELFHNGLDPDKEKHEDECKRKHGPCVHYWYHIAMLAVWPKRKTMEILGRGGFEGGLDLVEVKISKGEISDAELLYKDLLKLLHENPHSMSRILHLCAHFGDYEGIEKVIDVLGGHKQCPKDRQRYESKRFGIGNAEVAKMLALAIQTHGWEVCGSLIEEKLLLGSRISHECESYANLALEFQSIGMHAAAVSIAKKIGTLIQNLQGIITELTDSDVVATLIMLFKLPECHGELAPSLVDKIIKEATDITLGRVVTKLRDAGSRDISDAWSKKYFFLKENRVLLDLFIKICRGLTTRELKVPEKPQGLYSKYTEHKASKEIKKCIVEVMETFLWLEDMSLLEGMVKSIVSQSQKCKNRLASLRRLVVLNWEKVH